MKKTSKLKSKLCAWFLVCATVVTTLGSSGASVFADNETDSQQTETEFSTLSVKSGEGGEINVELPDGQVETASNGSDISVEVEKGSTVTATIALAEGYEVSTYRLTTDSVDSKDIDVYESYSFDITENMTLEATYNAVETEEVVVEEVAEPETSEETSEELEATTAEDAELNKGDESSVGVSLEEQEAYEAGEIVEVEPTYEKTYSSKARSARVGNTAVAEYGTNSFSSTSGVTRESLLNWLGTHVSDDFYLSTPYNPGWVAGSGMSADYRNPNGDCDGAYGVADKPGVPGMNCTGFVWHALTAAGGHDIPALSGWVTYLRTNNIQYRTYSGDNVNDIINTIKADGWAEAGDIIWMWDANAGNMRNGLSYGVSDYHHVGIYVGDYFDDSNPLDGWYFKTKGDTNGLWHSSDHNVQKTGNQISNILPKTACAAITVVKLDENPPKPKTGDVTLKKVSGDEK